MALERVIPLTSIGDYFNMQLQASPPYREKLGIREETLTSALDTLALKDTLIKLNFYNNEPRTTIIPDSSGNVGEITTNVVATSEKQRPRALINPDINGKSAVLMLPYTTEQTKTPEQTAHLASMMLDKAFAETPHTLYEYNRHLKGSNVRMDARINQTHFWGSVPLATLVTTGLMAAQIVFLGETVVRFRDMAGASLAGTYILIGILLLKGARINKENATESQIFLNKYLREDPRRAFYSPAFVHTYLIPSFLYSIKRLTQEDLVTPINTK